MNENPKTRRSPFLLSCLFGILVGLGGYTAHYARGFSYLSDDPKACAHCHVMREQYEGWLKSSHHFVATCNDCHTPHGFIGKYITKAENGFHHSMAFTLQNFHEPIMIREKNAKILNAACLHCHADMVQTIMGHLQSGESIDSCTRCHAGVGHGAQ